MTRILTTCLIVVSGFLVSCPGLGQEPVDFKNDVMPILKKHCAACHNDDDYEAGFTVDSYDGIEEGCDGEAVFVAGDPDDSWMIQLMTGNKEPLMPPDDQPRPTEDEIEILKLWIEQGANDSEADDPIDPNSKIELPAAVELNRKMPVTAVAWSNNDVVAVGRYQCVELLDAESMKSLGVLPHLGKVNSLEFSRDGELLWVAGGKVGQMGVAIAWNVSSQEAVQRIDGHRDAIYAIAQSPDETYVATASYDKQINLWKADSGELAFQCKGHNDAVYDLDFSTDSRNLLSASADQTIKVWSMADGKRLDTLGQPLKAQTATEFSPDNKIIAGGGADNRIRVWEFVSRESTEVNPLRNSCFAHEGPIVQLKFTPDGNHLVSSSEDKTIKVWDTNSFQQVATFHDQSDVCAALAISPNGRQIFVGRLDGSQEMIEIPEANSTEPIGVVGNDATIVEDGLAKAFQTIEELEPNNDVSSANLMSVPGYANGVIDGSDKDTDLFRFTAKKGQRLVVETRAGRNKSKLDSRIEILDAQGEPVPQVVLRAVRESYFTFRGKNSTIADDFRIHNWEEMTLNEYLYCNGEVVRLFKHPRGPDSGFMVYPGSGNRHTYFGTTAMTHALHETCYIVRPYPVGTEFQPNGLPTFRLNYENDDGSLRKIGSDSRVDFVAPADGEYIARVTDVRGFQSKDHRYRLEVRPAQPDFRVSIRNDQSINPGSGKEFSVSANRIDGFDKAITVEITGIPDGFSIDNPLVIEAGQLNARGTIFLSKEHTPIDEKLWKNVKVVARAEGQGGEVRKEVNGFKPISIAGEPKVEVRVATLEMTEAEAFDDAEPLVLTLRPGESIEAKIVLKRNSHKGRVSFGQADAGRNFPHGVYVDNIGLNGLMILAGKDEQRFFITAEKWVKPQERLFHLRANDVEGQITKPILLRIE